MAEGEPLRMRGESAAALVRYTRVLALAEDPVTAPQPDGEAAAWEVAAAYMDWADCARYVAGIPWRELFGVLDAADRWLTATGRRRWRAGVLLQRACVHRSLGEWDAALAASQEALTVFQPNTPGYRLSAYLIQFADILRDAGRHDEARPLCQATLDDPDTTAYGRCAAQHGLAWRAVAAGDPAIACRLAVAAVRMAEPFGDSTLCETLRALVAASRAAGDLDVAWQAARQMEAAGRVGEQLWLYDAVRDVVDVALDRGDLDTARGLLADLDNHAAVLDAAAGTTTRTREAAERRRGLEADSW
jgi:hypothetical protein